MFGAPVISYLFLGGLGGGVSMVLGAAGLAVPRQALGFGAAPEHRLLLGRSSACVVAVLALASLCLLIDSVHYDALPWLFFAKPFAYLSIGSWLLVAGMLLGVVLAVHWGGVLTLPNWAVRALHVTALVVGFGVALYTGLFLANMKAVPLWNSPALPILFVASALSCGVLFVIALGFAVGLGRAFATFFRRLAAVDAVLVGIEALSAAALLFTWRFLPMDTPTAVAGADSVRTVLFGPDAWIWWVGFVAVGLAVPLVLDVLHSKLARSGQTSFVLVAAVCVLVGALCMRACLVMAGAHPVASF